MRKISIVIPVYRNVDSIPILVERLNNELADKHPEDSFDYFFVDDGSDDGSLDVLLQLQKVNPRIEIYSLTRNFGQVNAIICGLENCKGDAVVIMGADLQEPVDKITEMIAKWKQGVEVVLCSRENRNDGLITGLTSRIFYRLIRRQFPQMPSGGYDFLLMDRTAVDSLNTIKQKNRFLQGDILWLGYSTAVIPYNREKRKHGSSQFGLSRRLKYFIDGLLNTSYWPIRMMSTVGIITFMIGVIYSLVIVYLHFVEKLPFQGWAPIMILLLLLGGLILFTLGIIGEYLWRIYDEVKDRPSYIVREKFTKDQS